MIGQRKGCPGVRCLILSNRWDCVGSMCAPNLHITSLPISIWPLIASGRGAGGSVSQGVPTRMGANISGTYFLPILCEKAGSLKKKLWPRVTFYLAHPDAIVLLLTKIKDMVQNDFEIRNNQNIIGIRSTQPSFLTTS